MVKVKLELFYSPTCPYCPLAKKMVAEVAPQFGDKLDVEEVNTWTPEGQRRAIAYGIHAVPTIAIAGKVKFVGVPPSKEELAKAIREEIKLAEAREREWDVCQSMLWNVGALTGVKSVVTALASAGSAPPEVTSALLKKAAEIASAVEAIASKQGWPSEERSVLRELREALAAAADLAPSSPSDALERARASAALVDKLVALVVATIPRCREVLSAS